MKIKRVFLSQTKDLVFLFDNGQSWTMPLVDNVDAVNEEDYEWDAGTYIPHFDDPKHMRSVSKNLILFSYVWEFLIGFFSPKGFAMDIDTDGGVYYENSLDYSQVQRLISECI